MKAKAPFFQKHSTFIQPKLTIGQPGDRHEQEADAMADQVVQRLAEPMHDRPDRSCASPAEGQSISPIQRKCSECAEEESLQKMEGEETKVQRKPIFESEGEDTGSIQTFLDKSTHIQRRCDACEQEEVNIQVKKESTHFPTSTTLKSSLNSSKGSGSSLTTDTLHSMEGAFGADFSQVRIHTNSAAVQMNQELGAQAFTHGSDIYFNQGKYDPSSLAGKGLLAHELTHTVQQGASPHVPKVQKATDPEFVISGKYPFASSDANIIYFDFASSTPDADETAKVVTLATDTHKDYDLVGFASEEGSDAVNSSMARRRINSVSRILQDNGHMGTRNPLNHFASGNNSLTYQRLRKVEVLESGASSSQPNCSITPATPHPEVIPCGTTFTGAHPSAISRVQTAWMEMLTALTDPVRLAWAMNAVDQLFHDTNQYGTILVHLINLEAQIRAQAANHECHNTCDAGCSNAVAYMDGTTGPSAKLTLCPSYMRPSLTAPISRRETLIHEALHATPGLATQDLAYESERGINFLDTATAMQNTDSYVLLIRELNAPGSVVGPGGSNRDHIDPAITGTQLSDLRRVMAYLEKWIIESTAETSSLYDMIVQARRPGNDWSSVSHPYYEDTMTFLAPLFGLTVPPIRPTEIDQVAVAGIHHRLMHMDRLLWETNIDIVKDDSSPVHFASGPAEPLKVTSAFLGSGQHAMVYTLVNKIVEATPDISSTHKPKYVQLIEEIRVHFGHSAP